MSRRIRAFVAEDEPVAREAIRDLIAETEWLELVGEAADGRTAVREIERLKPELVFLDVEMPELSGLGVLRSLEHRPLVVFTTAYDRYAVAAFEVEALDYLVKPFGRRRFHETLERVRRSLQVEAPAAERRDPLADAPLRRLFARSGRRMVPIDVADVLRFEADGDYARAVSRHGRHLLHVSLGELERRVEPGRFLRVHRSHLVAIDRIASLDEGDDRRLRVLLDDGSAVIASRSGSARLRRLVR